MTTSGKTSTYLVGDKRIVFDLNPGIYSAWPESAAGKTYTARLLQAITDRENILILTYESVKYLSEDAVCELIQKCKYELIFVDRADLYVTPAIYKSLDNANSVVYLDCKNNTYGGSICGRDCDISFSDKEICYYVDANISIQGETNICC